MSQAHRKNNIHGWDFDLVVHHAPARILREETALLESLEGKRASRG